MENRGGVDRFIQNWRQLEKRSDGIGLRLPEDPVGLDSDDEGSRKSRNDLREENLVRIQQSDDADDGIDLKKSNQHLLYSKLEIRRAAFGRHHLHTTQKRSVIVNDEIIIETSKRLRQIAVDCHTNSSRVLFYQVACVLEANW